MSFLQQAQQVNQQLEQAIKNQDYSENTYKLIQTNKLNTFQFDYLSQSIQNVNLQELQTARLFNELNVLYSLGAKNIEEYESSAIRLRTIYENYPNLQQSNEQSQFEALYLLYLLSFNRISEFHTYLELLPIGGLSNKFIKFVLDLERSITVGNYQEVLNSKKNSALPQFSLFLDRIIDTIRFETARSAEKSYASLQMQDALKIFNLQNQNEIQNFVQQQTEAAQENGYTWQINNNQLNFIPIQKDTNELDSEALIRKSLNYAVELERII